jgi:hypothetical protein
MEKKTFGRRDWRVTLLNDCEEAEGFHFIENATRKEAEAQAGEMAESYELYLMPSPNAKEKAEAILKEAFGKIEAMGLTVEYFDRYYPFITALSDSDLSFVVNRRQS